MTVPKGGSVTVVPTPTPSVCRLVNRRSGKVVDVPGAATGTGTALVQYADSDSDNQRWHLSAAARASGEFVNVHSGLAMDVQGGGPADGTAIIQWTPTHATNQQWELTDAGGGYSKIVNRRSGKVLGISATPPRTSRRSSSRPTPAAPVSTGSSRPGELTAGAAVRRSGGYGSPARGSPAVRRCAARPPRRGSRIPRPRPAVSGAQCTAGRLRRR